MLKISILFRCICILCVSAFGIITIIGSGGDDAGGGFDINFTLESYIAVGDLNGDELDDIVVTKIHVYDAPPHPGYVSVILQDQNSRGDFMPAAEYRVGDDPWFVAIDDLNNDSLPDLIVSNTKSDTISILFQTSNGDGTFLNSISISTSSYPTGIATGDIDGDGLKDIVVEGIDLSLHIQDQSNPGHFLPAEKIPLDLKYNPSDVLIADMDADGLLDIIIDQDTGSADVISVLFQDVNSPGSFTRYVTTEIDNKTQPIAIAEGDLDNDGFPDLAVARYGTPTDPDTASVSVLIQDPGWPGSFVETGNYKTGPRSRTVAIRDLNGDDCLDLVVANSGKLSTEYEPFIESYSITGGISVLLNNPAQAGTFSPAKNYKASDGYHAAATGYLNEDELPDIAAAADGVPVLFQDPANPGSFLPGVFVETGSRLSP